MSLMPCRCQCCEENQKYKDLWMSEVFSEKLEDPRIAELKQEITDVVKAAKSKTWQMAALELDKAAGFIGLKIDDTDSIDTINKIAEIHTAIMVKVNDFYQRSKEVE